MVNKTLLALFAAVVAFGGYLAWKIATRDPREGCGREIMAEAISPDRRFYAYVMEYDCNVFVGGNDVFITGMYSNEKPVLIGEISWARGCDHPPCITLRWVSPTSLVVEYGCSRENSGVTTALVGGETIKLTIVRRCENTP
ncbi:hypothetical protein [Fundidesulfovibrio butyratiphilus]